MKRRTWKDSTRQHEAAHAVVAHALGRTVFEIEVKCDKKNGREGVCKSKWSGLQWAKDTLADNPLDENALVYMRERVAYLLAGKIAEISYWTPKSKINPLTLADDRHECRLISIDEAAYGDMVEADEFLDLLPEKQKARELKAAEKLAKKLLKQNRALHQAVVEALRKKDILKYEDFYAIVDAVEGKPDQVAA